MSLPVDAPSTAVGEAKISRPQVSQDRTAPAPRAKGIASRISAFMRKGMEEAFASVWAKADALLERFGDIGLP